MMAMKALDKRLRLDRRLELRLWRESTTIFMTSGHGGCGPHGLALAAWRRGFAVELFVNDEGPPFLDTVRDPDKKAVIRLVHDDFLDEIARSDIKVHLHPLLGRRAERRVWRPARCALVLISQYRIYGDKEPHWIIVSGCDQRFIYAHDPYISLAHVTSTDRVSIPILRREFELMAKYGRSKLRAAVILSRRATPPADAGRPQRAAALRVPGSARASWSGCRGSTSRGRRTSAPARCGWST